MMDVVKVIRLEHVQLAMPAGREDEATAFYEGLLAIPRVPKPAHLAARGGCWFESGELKVHLGVEGDFRPASKAHPAFLVGDVRALAREISALRPSIRPTILPSHRPTSSPPRPTPASTNGG